MGLVHNGHLDIRALLSCGRELLSLQHQDVIWGKVDEGDRSNDDEADGKKMMRFGTTQLPIITNGY